MDRVIKDGELTTPSYQLFKAGETAGTIVPLEMFLDLDDTTDTGVWLNAGEDVEAIEDKLREIPVIALNYPAFTDGRAYSSASILRRRYGYTGEIRAMGDVRIDQLEQMSRCGFDTYQLSENQDAKKTMGVSLKGFSYSYPTTAKQPPLFSRRKVVTRNKLP